MKKSLKNFNLPWNQAEHYWICLNLPEGDLPAGLSSDLSAIGMSKSDGYGNRFQMKSGRKWDENWLKIHAVLGRHQIAEKAEVSILANDDEPDPQDVYVNKRAVDKIQKIAENLWIGEALIEDKITCYLQKVIDRRGKVFGYESFARMDTGKEQISGGRIIAASMALNIEHMIDRYLHVQALRTFITNDLSGVLFVNFVPGFIHRPDVYLEGLTDAAKSFGFAPKNIALELTKSEMPADKHHLKAIFDYCKSKGYSISLDDIESYEVAKRLVSEVTPDFFKIDIQLVKKIGNPKDYALISQLIEIAHSAGCTVIAEGVETKETHQMLLDAGVDLFQGYLFSPPTKDGK